MENFLFEKQLHLLLIEHDDADAKQCKAHIQQAFGDQHTVQRATSLSQALRLLANINFDMVVLDVILPDCDDIEGLKAVIHAAPNSPVIVMSHRDDPNFALETVRAGAQDYLVKGRGDAFTLKRIMEYSLERKRAEASIKKSRERLHYFIKHTPAAVAIFDTNMRYIAYSDRWLDDYDLKHKKLYGHSHYEIFPDQPEEWREIHKRCLKGLVHECNEYRFDRPSADPLYIRWNIHPWFEDDMSIGGIIMFTEIITEQVELKKQMIALNNDLEQRVQERTAELEKSNEYKTSFFTNITHELRTPLHAIINFSRFGMRKFESAPREKLEEYFDDINKSGERLLWLVNDILDLSKLQSTLNITLEKHQINTLLQDVQELSKAQLKEYGIKLQLNNISKHTHATVDDKRFSQVMQNLVSNAIKFSPKGSVITVTASDETIKKVPHLVITVDDEGEGIPIKERKTVFDAFAQSQKVRSGQFATGTGLGLAICKEIMQAHNGTITASSSPSKGARITIALPITPHKGGTK